ncbi:hypothetical protein A2U01_0063000, partial [Trifolium medium]|nr:hypothetical protein [Trifolium medium]
GPRSRHPRMSGGWARRSVPSHRELGVKPEYGDVGTRYRFILVEQSLCSQFEWRLPIFPKF